MASVEIKLDGLVECYNVPRSGTNGGLWAGAHSLTFALPLLSVQLFLVFVTTRTLHFLLRPLRQPRVVSEIIGGIILGPSVLGRHDKFRETIFPPRGKPVLETIAAFGLMYVIFLIGVKMDPGVVKRSGRKALVIALLGHLASTAAACLAFLIAGRNPFNFSGVVVVLSVSAVLALSSFAVLVPILAEFKLLNSELGRTAVSASMTNDGLGWVIALCFVMVQARPAGAAAPIYVLLAVAMLAAFILFVVRPLALWVVDNTLPGKPVEEGYIFVLLIVVLVVGFYSDVIGTNTFHGALILGLAIPDGPPLGASLTEKIECIVTGLLLPLYYALTGLYTDVSSIRDKHVWGALQLILIFGWAGKLIGTLLPSLYYGIPFRDALSLGLFMNCKGIVEVITYNYWRTNKLLDDQTFAILILSNVAVTAMASPLAMLLYQPSRQYVVYKRRTVQHTRPDMELRVLACVHDQSHVPPAMSFLESLYATPESPICVYALHLVELVGRAAPLFIPHKMALARSPSLTHHASKSHHIINAFLHLEQRHPSAISVHPFTTISPYASMHDEVCRLALEKRSAIILLPFHRKRVLPGAVTAVEGSNGLRTVNRNVIRNAPCSVGVLVGATVNNPVTLSGEFSLRVAVLFFGGEDDREGLAIAARMAQHPSVALTVVRFLPSRSIRDNPVERRMDLRLLDEFRHENARNERVEYKQALVRDMEEIVTVIRALEGGDYDLMVVGMRHRSNSVLSEEMATWGDCPELGVVGDFLASPDFDVRFSVLIVKQQDRAGDDDGDYAAGAAAGEQVAHERDPSPRRIVGNALYMEDLQMGSVRSEL